MVSYFWGKGEVVVARRKASRVLGLFLELYLG